MYIYPFPRPTHTPPTHIHISLIILILITHPILTRPCPGRWHVTPLVPAVRLTGPGICIYTYIYIVINKRTISEEKGCGCKHSNHIYTLTNIHIPLFSLLV